MNAFYDLTSTHIIHQGVFISWPDVFGFFAIIFLLKLFVERTLEHFSFVLVLGYPFIGVNLFFHGGMNGLISSLFLIMSCLSFYSLIDSSKGVSGRSLNPFILLSPLLALVFFIFFSPEGYLGLLPSLGLFFMVLSLFLYLKKLSGSSLYLWFFQAWAALVWAAYSVLLESLPATIFHILLIAISLTYLKDEVNKGFNVR